MITTRKYPITHGQGELEKMEKKLSKSELKILEDYLVYRKARGLNTKGSFSELRRMLIKVRYVLDKSLEELDLTDLRRFLSVLNDSGLSANFQNKVKTDLRNFLRFQYKDWSMRFDNFDDVKSKQGFNESKINNSNIYTKEDIEKMVTAETKVFWRAFLMCQFEGGLRTIETRSIKWSDLKFDGDFAELNIFATKTKRARAVYLKSAVHYLNLLKQEQENEGKKGVYVFCSRANPNKPIQKNSVNKWFSKLSQKALGRKGWNYLLRHSRGTQLYRMAKENKIDKDIAIQFMGHSEDMSKTYTHIDATHIKEMLKNQVYNIDKLPKERKHKIEEKLDVLQETLLEMMDIQMQMVNGKITPKDTLKKIDEYKKKIESV